MRFPDLLISVAKSKKRSPKSSSPTVAISSLSIVTTIEGRLSTNTRPSASRIRPLGAVSIIVSVVLSAALSMKAVSLITCRYHNRATRGTNKETATAAKIAKRKR